MVAAGPRIRHGLVLPAIPAQRGQTVLELEPEACLHRGYDLRSDAAGLHLYRIEDGESLGVMPSREFACNFAATVEREAIRRRSLEEQP